MMPSFALSAILAFGGLLGVLGAVFVLLPLLVAAWEEIKMCRNLSPRSRRFEKSKLCVGQVWHTRFHPKRHAFTYPIFMFALDLEESFDGFLWPIVRFQSHNHHLKNGEGTTPLGDTTDKESSASSSNTANNCTVSLAQRILNLVATKTQNKLQPSLTTHQIILLTHLEYFGYNFNPVSFYYLVNKSTNVLDAIVGEVSNTPWTEMYCYVLHPDSIDRVRCQEKVLSSSSSDKAHEYRFPKQFHVSPFMEMEYWYDWTFQGIPGHHSSKQKNNNEGEFLVTNSSRRRSAEETLYFTATLRLTSKPITPWTVAWQMIRFPFFCAVIQIWIHYQAAWLFLKGVEYVPHPQGTETIASKTIAAIMTPFFAIRDSLRPPSTTSSSSTKED